jgi:hypothetical protein
MKLLKALKTLFSENSFSSAKNSQEGSFGVGNNNAEIKARNIVGTTNENSNSTLNISDNENVSLILNNPNISDAENTNTQNSPNDKLIHILTKYSNNLDTTYKNQILYAYSLSLPKRTTSEDKTLQNVEGIINELIKMPLQKDNYSCIDKFVLNLLLEDISCLELNKKLTEWRDKNIHDWNKLDEELRRRRKECYPVLMVAISEQKPNYVVEAWLLKNLAKDNQYSSSDFEHLTINQQTDETLKNIPQLIKELISQRYDKCREPLEQIHIFLPAILMYYAVDCWKIDNNELARTIGEEYEVVLRCSERLRGRDRLFNKWYSKKSNFSSNLGEPAEEIFQLANSDSRKSLLKELLQKNEVLAFKITTFSQQKELGPLLWQASVPIALWIRQQSASVENKSEELDTILKKDELYKIPNKVKIKRLDAFDCEPPETHIGRHLCLLWDDPNLLPPTQNLTQSKL